MKTIALGFAAILLLGGCSTTQLAAVSTGAANAQAAAVKFCTTDQPVIGVVATIAADGTAAAVPATAPVATVTGLIVQDVNGVCAGLTAVPAPPAGTQVVVPSAAP